MIQRPRLAETLSLQLLWGLSASFVWARVVTERVLELHEGHQRTALIVLLFGLCVGFASWGARRLDRSRLRYLPLLLLAAMAMLELRRHALREQYAASAAVKSVGPTESLWRPVTTTDIALRYYALTSKQLLRKRLRLVLLTDLHITPALPREYYEQVIDLVRAQDADLVLLAGDYVSMPENIPLLARFFARRWPARFGTFAVLGNHDHWTDPVRVRAALDAGRITLVENHCERLPRELGRIAICGTDTPWGPELSSELDRSEFNLVLSHTPDNVYRLAEQGASLVLSGHTHGGQIRLPGFGSVVVPSRFGRLFDEGHFRVAGADLFVSAGVGADDPALRIYCQPELLVIDLQPP